MSKYDGHTTGPIAIKGPSPGGTPHDDGGDYAIIDSSGYIIGEAIYKLGWGAAHDIVYGSAKANAELWAAAPDLLAENERLRDVCLRLVMNGPRRLLTHQNCPLCEGPRLRDSFEHDEYCVVVLARAARAKGDTDA